MSDAALGLPGSARSGHPRRAAHVRRDRGTAQEEAAPDRAPGNHPAPENEQDQPPGIEADDPRHSRCGNSRGGALRRPRPQPGGAGGNRHPRLHPAHVGLRSPRGFHETASGAYEQCRARSSGAARRAGGIHYRIIFLEAEDSILVKRFKETRRKHPMLDHQTPLVEAIDVEKKLLEPLSFEASLRIDTTRTTPHELRMQVRNFARGEDTAGMTLLFESFGYKHGTPLDADFVFDVRCLPNPYWQTDLRRYNGLDEPVVHFLEQYDEVKAMFEELCGFLEKWLPRFEREDRTYLTIAIGCTGGQHRSVYLVRRLAEYFSDKGVKTQVRHRELK